MTDYTRYNTPLGESILPDAAQVADSAGLLVPMKLVKAFNASATLVSFYNANAPFKFRVIGFEVHVTTKAAQTARLNDGTNNITDAVSLNPTNNNSKVPAGTIDPTYATINQNGSLAVTLSAAGGAGMAIVEIIKVS